MYKHYKEAIEKYTGVECIGYLPKDESLSVSSRHLGLLQAEEIDGLREKSKHLKEILQKTIDVERLLEIAELGEKDGIKNPFEELKDIVF